MSLVPAHPFIAHFFTSAAGRRSDDGCLGTIFRRRSAPRLTPLATGKSYWSAPWGKWLLGVGLASCITPALAQQPALAPLQGTWVGSAQLFGSPTPLVLDFAPLLQPGAKRALLALPTSGLHGIQLDTIQPQADSLCLSASALPGTLVLRFTADTLGLAGFLLAGGQRAAVRLSPSTPQRLARVVPRRPQEPLPPYPYQQLPTRFTGGSPGVTLAGTITTPRSRRGPAIIFISGSGPHNREGEEFGHKSFLVPADALTRRGFIVLRYDERGVGASTGRYATAKTVDFARDAAAAVRALRTDSRLHVRKVYLIGHSQGTLEAVRVAAHDPTLAGVVLLGGIGRPNRLSYQDRTRANFRDRLAAASATARPGVEKYLRMNERLIEIAAAHPDSAIALTQMRREAPALGVSVEEVGYYAPAFLDHTLHDILVQDPTSDLRRLKMPILALTGEADTETPAASELPALREQLHLAGNSQVTTGVIPHVNHFFQTNLPGQEKSLFDNPETFSPVELRLLVEWLTKQAGLPMVRPRP
jgi:pimeloyl-ACP methyl ester carboxylesterase